ncbi:hypothetical protein [Agromyces sp. SYSU T00194]|uniref:hypothetical protein n=1 Tax=Agromyces chitinivorans TaxID=3158560 RepID=UPI003395C4E7
MPRLRLAIVVTALAAMVIVPGIASLSETPTFLGWHMYSGYQTGLVFEVEHDDGSTEAVPIAEIAAGNRIEVDYAEPGSRFLCARDATLVRVRAVREHPALDEEFACADF